MVEALRLPVTAVDADRSGVEILKQTRQGVQPVLDAAIRQSEDLHRPHHIGLH